ncbi:uncharacterized protein N7506_001620 [Penicillium brevicompactum]|uniref:uncharacterized protein n=1 Tax=Penicillium brevicompactum TaxID=5074 RepID=UPI002540442B|nr:uncharacterized protein N7506_001620 [Penicillium brevicompactum]KAJ5348367.1 hypothetical protein N7506_001620 [Penicillium brevicompactum]
MTCPKVVEAAIEALPQQHKSILIQLENLYFDYINQRPRKELSEDLNSLSQTAYKLAKYIEENDKSDTGFSDSACAISAGILEAAVLVKETPYFVHHVKPVRSAMENLLQATFREFRKIAGQVGSTEEQPSWRFRMNIVDRRLKELGLAGTKQGDDISMDFSRWFDKQ